MDISTISFDNKMEFYTDAENIPNQELVQETVNWFEMGAGARAFSSLQFLNLIWKQYCYSTENIEDTEILVDHFRRLPLNDLEKHILFGLIIKWFGGYPLEAPMPVAKSRLYYDFQKRLLEFFLEYPEETPEKDFCKVNWGTRKLMTKLSVAFTESINSGIPVKELLDNMNNNPIGNVVYNNFEELFNAAIEKKLLDKPSERNAYLRLKSLYNYKFNVWLQKNEKWEYGDGDEYRQLLGLEYFKEFLLSDKEDQDSINFLNGLTLQEAFNIFVDRHNELRGKFRVRRMATKEDCAQIPRLKEGDIISYEPDYKTSLEAFVLLTDYYAKTYLELEKYNFIETYKVANEKTIKAEISELEKFISVAKNSNVTEACTSFGKSWIDKNEFIYKRLEIGFYENIEVERYPLISSIGNGEAFVYGKYFLFYNYLKESLKVFDRSEEDFIEFMEIQIRAEQTAVSNGFHRLQEYIENEVYKDLNADILRLKQLKRNLMGWKEQLQNNFIDPERLAVRESLHFEEWKSNAVRMQGKIIAALDVIEVRVQGKEEINGMQNSAHTMIMDPSEIERLILRKGRKD